MKVLFRLILSLWVLLAGVPATTYASQGHTKHYRSINSKRQSRIAHYIMPAHEAVLTDVFTAETQDDYCLFEFEDDTDELPDSNKNLENDACRQPQNQRYRDSQSLKSTYASLHETCFRYSSSPRYIFFQNFRI